MTGPVRPLPPLRMAVRGLLFLARMWASERRFRRHARRAGALEARRARHLDVMAAECEFRVALCRRHRVQGYAPRTTSGVPAVRSISG